MTMHERFQQSGLRERGMVIARDVVNRIKAKAPEVTEGVWYYTKDDAKSAYRGMNLDNYDKIALLAFLTEKSKSRYGSVAEVDALIEKMILRIL